MTNRIGDVHILRDGFIARVTIDKPPINAVSVDLMRDLADALEMLDKDGVTRAVVLATAGKVFCSGADLSNRTSEGPIPERSINPLYDQAVRLFSTELPMIAAVQGAAIGAGLGLSLIADFRVATPEAKFAANFTKLGFHPGFGLTYTLPRLIGRQNAAMMFLTDRAMTDRRRWRWGWSMTWSMRPACWTARIRWPRRLRRTRRWLFAQPARRCGERWPRACGLRRITSSPNSNG